MRTFQKHTKKHQRVIYKNVRKKNKLTKEEVMILHEIRRPNSLKKSHQWSRQLLQPTLRREGDAGLTGASSMGGKCADSPPTFI